MGPQRQPAIRLRRAVPRGSPEGSTAGYWIVVGMDLMLIRDPTSGYWEFHPAALTLDAYRRVYERKDWQWLERRGLIRAEFPTRRAALQALEYALQREPPEPLR